MHRIVAVLVVTVATMAAGAASAEAAGLSKARYRALDRVATTFIPLDKDKPSGREFAAATRSCYGLPKSDALLSVMRPLCFATVSFARLSAADCNSRASCLRFTVNARTATQRLIGLSIAANQRINRVVKNRGCAAALRTSAKDLRNARKVVDAFALLERGLRRNSKSDVERAGRQIDAINDDDTSARTERARFRRACG